MKYIKVKLQSLLATFIFMLSFSIASKAQLIGNDVFLKGKHLEVGIGQTGAYGTVSNAPVGYHTNAYSGSSSQLGMIADPGRDGWSVGSPPFFGDYFMAGYPMEGWIIQQGNNTASATWNGTIVSPLPVPCGNISYNVSGTKISTTWQGIYNSLKIEQITTLDTNDLYITSKINITNLSTTPRDSFYYMRVLDPDNDANNPMGTFHTNNIIERQRGPSDSGLTVVSATAPAHTTAYLALGTKDPRAKCFIMICGSGGVSGLDSIYSELKCFFTPGIMLVGDTGIGIIFNVGNIDPGETKSISYIYAFKPGLIDSVARYTDTLGVTAFVNEMNHNPITIYPNPFNKTLNVAGVDLTDEITLYDVVGKELVVEKEFTGQYIRTLSLVDVPIGTYFLAIRDNNGQIRHRSLVQKE